MYNISIHFFDKSKYNLDYRDTINISEIKTRIINNLKKLKGPEYIFFVYYGNILEDHFKFVKKNVVLNAYINRKFLKDDLDNSNIINSFIDYVSNVNRNINTHNNTILDRFIDIINRNDEFGINGEFNIRNTQLSENINHGDTHLQNNNNTETNTNDNHSDNPIDNHSDNPDDTEVDNPNDNPIDNPNDTEINIPIVQVQINQIDYQRQNEILIGMGYLNNETNMFVLELNNGDINSSIDFLESLK